MTKGRPGIVILVWVSLQRDVGCRSYEREKRDKKREVRLLLLVSELRRYNEGGESTAVFREGKWEVTEAAEHAKVRTLCVGEWRLGCLLGSR